jgi:hypothetical protein
MFGVGGEGGAPEDLDRVGDAAVDAFETAYR